VPLHSLVEVALIPSQRLSCVGPRVLPRGAGPFFFFVKEPHYQLRGRSSRKDA
jgi:hypothetical protein